METMNLRGLLKISKKPMAGGTCKILAGSLSRPSLKTSENLEIFITWQKIAGTMDARMAS